jgi:hypothetical protein
MGCGPSTHLPVEVLGVCESDNICAVSAKELQRVYLSADRSPTGITFQQFALFFEFERSKFVQRVFDLSAGTSNQLLGFLQFLCLLWCFCSRDEQELEKFMFSMLMGDNKVLSVEDIVDFTRSTHKSEAILPAHRRLLQCIAKDHQTGKPVTLEEFKNYARMFPALLLPVYLMQRKLQHRSLGCSKWEQLRKIQREQGGGAAGWPLIARVKDVARAVEVEGSKKRGQVQQRRRLPATIQIQLDEKFEKRCTTQTLRNLKFREDGLSWKEIEALGIPSEEMDVLQALQEEKAEKAAAKKAISKKKGKPKVQKVKGPKVQKVKGKSKVQKVVPA